MSKIEQIKIPLESAQYKLVREHDNKTLYGTKIGWVEWNDDGTFKKLHDTPQIGVSLIIDPHRMSFTWLTTPVTEIIENSDELVFQTYNSKYTLTKTE